MKPAVMLALVVLVAAASGAARAADGDVTARLVAPEGEFTVGDPVTLKLTVTHPPGAVFDFPQAASLAEVAADAPAAAGPPFVVEEVEPVHARPPLPGETSWTVRIRPFVPGEIRLPALPLTYRLADPGGEGTVSTAPIAVTVTSVLQSEDDNPADIKGPWRLPPEWWRVAAWMAMAAALAGVAWLIWRRLRGRRKTASAAPEVAVPKEPPYDRAVRDLEQLLASDLLRRGLQKEFHVRLSEIVRRFLGDHYGFDALDRTTEEILDLLDRTPARPDLEGPTARFLSACDLVKFAKHRPDMSEIDETVRSARALIETGRPAPSREETAAA